MVFRTTSTNQHYKRQQGFTLPEFLFSFLISMIALATLVAVYVFSARGFQMLFNYAGLNQESRTAMDTLTRDIRQARAVSAFTTNTLTLVDSDGTALTYAYSPSTRTLTRSKGAVSKVLLEECDRLRFDLGARNAVGGSYDVYAAATAADAKVIDVSWLCSRTIFGAKQNTEAVQTARIVIRKQGT
jgi:Tfp pilus assembly protein PilW